MIRSHFLASFARVRLQAAFCDSALRLGPARHAFPTRQLTHTGKTLECWQCCMTPFLCGARAVLKPLVFLAGFFLAGWVALGILVAGVELLSLELAVRRASLVQGHAPLSCAVCRGALCTNFCHTWNGTVESHWSCCGGWTWYHDIVLG